MWYTKILIISTNNMSLPIDITLHSKVTNNAHPTAMINKVKYLALIF